MSTLKSNVIEPATGTDLSLGAVGDNVTVSSDSLQNNVWKDAGANALFTSNGSGVLSGVNAGFGGSQVLLSTQTASSSASLSFTSGIDSTYKEYVFEFITVNAATDGTQFTFQCSTDGGSNYNVTMTTTYFTAWHDEGDSQTGLGYDGSKDQAQGTAYQTLTQATGSGADECLAGELHLFNPSSTTYVKNWYATISDYDEGNTTAGREVNTFPAGYFNTTTALNAIQFKMASGNFDGTIKMYGIK